MNGRLKRIDAIEAHWDEIVKLMDDNMPKVLREEIEKYGAENIIFLTELKHGSPFNAVVSLTRDYDVYHVTGTNLAMLMTIVLERDFEGATCEGLCEAAINAAADSYVDVRKMLMDSDDDEEDE